MSNKVLLVLLCGACGMIGWLWGQGGDERAVYAQVETVGDEWYPYQLVIFQKFGVNYYKRFNRETGILNYPKDEIGNDVVLKVPEQYEVEIDKKGNIIVFRPNTGIVWKTNNKKLSIVYKGTAVFPILQPVLE